MERQALQLLGIEQLFLVIAPCSVSPQTCTIPRPTEDSRLRMDEVLGSDGLLSRHIDGFSFRSQQLAMAEMVADTMDSGGVLITEAGTGTGKTFAYLVPALLSGRKVIISTGTKNLQDQLFHRDLPLVQEALAHPLQVALLKGRANYLCPHRMDNVLQEGRFRSREIIGHLDSVKSWSATTTSGDIAELMDVPEDSGVWPLVTSTTDNCIGAECPVYSDCHLAEARRRAQEADIVVINHHLLCADFALKEEGFGELLPEVDCFIVDEAHQLAETASNFFGLGVSGRQLLELARDTEAEYRCEAGDVPGFQDLIDALSKATRDLRLAFGVDMRRGAWSEIGADRQITQALERLQTTIAELAAGLDALQERGKGLASCFARCSRLVEDLESLCGEDSATDIRWFETFRQTFRLNRTPLEIDQLFRAQMESRPASWIFTSATLAVGDSFSHFQERLGLTEAETARWDSPFDYPEQALWYVPTGMPEPRSADYMDAVLDIVAPVVEASRGRAFLLFTSHRALRIAATALESRLEYPLLVQGSGPKGELLEQFRQLGNAVLLGTSSFWEGVDVRGEALSCVIIDKLPFASPGDPVLQARIDAIKQGGGNPFMQLQVPQAAIALKQGAGRLIRDATDRGVLVLCDPRLLKKGYGHTFLNSMPPMARTRELADVERFFAQ